MKKIKVRGIYSTALSKFLLDSGYEIVSPSEKQMERLEIGNKLYPIDAAIMDYKNGIKVVGPCSREIAERICEEFDAICFEDYIGRIYRGEILGSLGNSIVLRIGGYTGILNEPLLSKKPLVQIKKEENGVFHLTQDIRIFGKYIVLIKDGINSFHKEFPEEEKNKFREINTDGFGIFFTQFSIGRSIEEIKEDIEDCLRKYKEIQNSEKFSFKRSWVILFTKEGREKLDKIRSFVLPTARKHHLIRMLGMDGKLDIIEAIDPERIDLLEREYFWNEVELIHDKIIGNPIIRKEKILERKDGFVRTYREMKSLGFYDGLKVRKIPGDYAISEIQEGEVFYKITYFRKMGKKIGEYFNFNTPIEIFGNKIYYIDLCIDLIHVNDKWIVVDVDEFKRMIKEFPKLEKYEKIIWDKIKEICGGEKYEIKGS